jgi:type II secretory pathway component PulF
MLAIGAHEAAALQFDDLASALEAGLPIAALGGDAAAGDRVVHGILRQRQVRLTPTEDTVLVHAWRAGTAAAALRSRAEQRRQRAEFLRTLWSGLRYPLLLLGMVLLLATISTATMGNGFLFAVLALIGALGAGCWLVFRGVQRGAEWVDRLPWIGPTLRDAGELPYLETLHALYGAGVPLLAAHEAALASVAVVSVRVRLTGADRVLREGRPLAEALLATGALHPETRQLLATAEPAGQLEDALRRALQRRRDVVARNTAAAARRLGMLLYAGAALTVAAFVVKFYSGYYAQFSRYR